MEAAALTVRSTSQCLAASAPAAHGYRRRVVFGRSGRQAPCGQLRAFPQELSEILSPKLVPGSPAESGDVSSLIPVSALMLLMYLVSNWVVPEVLLKRLQQPTAEDEASTSSTQTQQGVRVKGRKTKRKKKSSKESMKV